LTELESLIKAYGRHIALPWQRGLAGPQKVLFAVYRKEDELRLRTRLGEFEIATKEAVHGWLHLDVTDFFPAWISANAFRDSYFEEPELLDDTALRGFKEYTCDRIRQKLEDSTADDDTVLALSGIGSLFGFLHVRDVVEGVEDAIRGRLLVLFPGSHAENSYRLLDAREGWNYLAVPILAEFGR